MRFAYLIMAHDNEQQLLKLLKMLDYAENDIYLHVDKKSCCFQIEDIKKVISYATIHIYSKYKVYWADISQTKCQMFLLEQATKSFHDYYHLLSGHDLPLKSHDEILLFFEKNAGKEYVHFESKGYCKKENCVRYHFWRYLINRIKSTKMRCYLEKMESISIGLQKSIGIVRKLYCGANWYSITHRLALDFLAEKNKLLRRLKFTVSSDEYILQTYLMECGKKYNLCESTKDDDYKTILRNIDWSRGGPYVWRKENFKELVDSDYLFARKFNQNVDDEIIDMIVDHVKKKSSSCNDMEISYEKPSLN